MILFDRLRKKGVSADILVIILLVVGLAIAILMYVSFAGHGKETGVGIFNLTKPLKEAVGFR